MKNHFQINNRRIGPGESVYIIAEISANHHQDFDTAMELVEKAAEAGADALKTQTYTPETLTLDSNKEWFQIDSDTAWDGQTLYELYSDAYMPWEWNEDLQERANELGMDFFSTAYDESAVEHLEELEVPVHKVASFELVDLPLIRRMAESNVPMIISTGMGTMEEIREAVSTASEAGCEEVALLKCTSAYPAPPEEMNLRTIPDLRDEFDLPVGLSDHTLGTTVPVISVALGATIIEKHFTLSRDEPGADSEFSLEPSEFKKMVEEVRLTEKALGSVSYGPTDREEGSQIFRRSLFAAKKIKKGEELSSDNIRSVRPGNGLAPRHYEDLLGKKASSKIEPGTPLSWDLIEEN